MEGPGTPRIPAWRGPSTPLIGALLVAVVLAVHARALGATFVWDDRDIALRWPPQLLERGALLTGPFTEQGGYYRPLVSASYVLDHWLFGQSAAGFHLTNLVAHAAVTVLVFLWAARLGASPPRAACLAGLWAVLPRLTESVTWISGRTDVFMAAFGLAAFLLWPREPGSARVTFAPGRRLAACGLLALSLGAKETGLAPLAAVIALEWGGGGSTRRHLAWTLALTALGGAFWFVRSRVLQGYHVDVELPPAARLLAIGDALGGAALALLDPFDPASILGAAGEARPSRLLLGGLLALLLAGLGVAALHTRRVELCAAWILGVAALLAPLPWLPNPVNTSYADRFLYLPTAAGMACLAALRLPVGHWPGRWTLPALGVLFALLAWQTNARISHYHDPLRFWTVAVVDTEGRRTIALRNLGAALQEQLELEDAERVYRHTLELHARGVDAFLDTSPLEKDLANVLSLQGKHADALHLRLALAERHPEPRAWLDVARSALPLRKLEQAERALAQQRAGDLPEALPIRLALSSFRADSQGGLWSEPKEQVPLVELRERLLIADSLSWRTLAIDTRRRIVGHPDATTSDVAIACAVLCQVGDLHTLELALTRLSTSWPASHELPVLAACARERAAAHQAALELRRAWAPFVLGGGGG